MPDGTLAYTRDGSFQTNATGQLVTASGYPVVPAITLPANSTSLTIASTGAVTVTQANSTANVQIGTLQLATFMNPTGLQSSGSNLYIETDSSGTPSQVAP